MSVGIDLRGKDQVLNQFELFDTPFFCVMQGKDIKFFNTDENVDSARELLENNLSVLEQNGSVAPFKIVYYTNLNDKGKLVAENIKGSNTFRVCNPMMGANNPNYGSQEIVSTSWGIGRVNNKLVDDLNKRVEDLELKNQLLIEQLESEAEPDNEPQGIAGIVSGLLANPEIQTAIIGRLLNFVDGLLPKKNEFMNNTAIAGITENKEFSKLALEEIECLETLKENGMTIEDLAKLTEISVSNKGFFNSLLTTLRSL